MAFKDYFINFQQLVVNEQIILRQTKPEQDLQDYFKIYLDAEANQYYAGYSRPRDHEAVLVTIQNQINEFNKRRVYNWTIADSKTDKVFGRILLSDFQNKNTAANIGYFLEREHWGKGIITASITQVINFGFNNMKLERIFTIVEINNIASWKALEKNGFIREGMQRKAMSLPDGLHDCYMYAKLATN